MPSKCSTRSDCNEAGVADRRSWRCEIASCPTLFAGGLQHLGVRRSDHVIRLKLFFDTRAKLLPLHPALHELHH
jgi:hypothetical protein